MTPPPHFGKNSQNTVFFWKTPLSINVANKIWNMSKHVNLYLLGLNQSRLSQLLRVHVCKQNYFDARYSKYLGRWGGGGVIFTVETGIFSN